MSALTALEIRELTNILKPFFEREYLDRVYPIGSLYFSANEVNPNALFGGTWERIKDKFLLASGDSYAVGSEGGSADAVVVEHRHQGLYWGDIIAENSYITLNTGGGSAYGLSYGTSDNDNIIFTGREGVDGTGKNMPPYLSICVWKRTA